MKENKNNRKYRTEKVRYYRLNVQLLNELMVVRINKLLLKLPALAILNTFFPSPKALMGVFRFPLTCLLNQKTFWG
jgi:hypothetical protein